MYIYIIQVLQRLREPKVTFVMTMMYVYIIILFIKIYDPI